MKASLRADLTVYVEYSNEVWNGLFAQGIYSQAQGAAFGLSAASFGSCGIGNAELCLRARYTARRTNEVGTIGTFENRFSTFID